MSSFLEISWAKTHNLKNVSVKIPKNKLVVITGVSGSGKSSLAFDTIHAEGQRRYLESLSTYARMIISSINEDTKVDEIRGLSPTISIDQKTVSSNPRSTVGTITEIYDFCRLLYTTIGVQSCPNHPDIVLRKHTVSEVTNHIRALDDGTKIHLLAPMPHKEGRMDFSSVKKRVLDAGFVRFQIDGVLYSVGDEAPEVLPSEDASAYIVVDRLVVRWDDEAFSKRVRDSVELAYRTGHGLLSIYQLGETSEISQKRRDLRENQAPEWGVRSEGTTNEEAEIWTRRSSFSEISTFSEKSSCPLCNHGREELSISHFSFNSHQGACPDCHGLGTRVAFLEENIINPNLSLAEGAILPWTNHSYYLEILEGACRIHKIDPLVPYKALSTKAKNIILHGSEETFDVKHHFDGGREKIFHTRYEWVITNLTRRYLDNGDGDAFLKRIAQFATEIECATCQGHRLRQESLHVRVGGKHIGEIMSLPVRDSLAFFHRLPLSKNEQIITKNILKNIVDRLEFLSGVGLDYMTLARRAGTLSGGESQRIRLATQIGTRLEGIIYILDEPSIGLHPRDNDMLIANIKRLVSIGNTVLVVEHDEDIMAASDYIVDIGPGAGKHGGSVISTGTYAEIVRDPKSETGLYLSGQKRVLLEKPSRKPSGKIMVRGASENNLRNIDVDIPLGVMTVVTGVSGSGKSSLVMDTLANHLTNKLMSVSTIHPVGKVGSITMSEMSEPKTSIKWWNLDEGREAKWGVHRYDEWASQAWVQSSHFRESFPLDKAIIIDQSPIGRTPHSNIATYTGVFTYIREVFASSLEAQKRGYGVGRFSFNTKWGRCELCEGSGTKKIEMHFLPDVYVECEACHGSRYNPETLEVKFKGKSIAEVLRMTVEDSLDFFTAFPRIKRVLEVLNDVGLGYIELGQSAPTLSGGEAQRIKLAFDLSKRSTSKTIYILDEPSTGLHFSDIQKLLLILDRLVEKGNTVLIIEHNLDIIANADYCIDIGPEWGDRGGELLYAGPLAGVMKEKRSFTGEALRRHLDRHTWTTRQK